MRFTNPVLFAALYLVQDAVSVPVPAGAPALNERTAAKVTAASCKAKRSFDQYNETLVGRDSVEFIGWHGTNNKVAAFWKTEGELVKPPAKTVTQALFDFVNGLGTTVKAGTSGADQELGLGVYVTDDPFIATNFAKTNSEVNPGTTPEICAIFAKSSLGWRAGINKVLIPKALLKDSSVPAQRTAAEAARIKFAEEVDPCVAFEPTQLVKISVFDKFPKANPGPNGQLLLPSTVTNQFTSQCFPIQVVTVANAPSSAFIPTGFHAAGVAVAVPTFPEFSFIGKPTVPGATSNLRQLWDVQGTQL